MSISDFVRDPGFPVYPDALLIDEYLRSGAALPPLMTSIGDPSFTAAKVPPKLLDYLHAAPAELHGYQASMGGLPGARRAVGDYLMRTTGIDTVARHQEDFEVALSAGGTRGVIGDFARLLRRRARALVQDSIPIALCASPSWDYAGPLVEAGYEMEYWPLRAENGWMPDVADIRQAVETIAARRGATLALVVVNAQHNPTGRGWSSETLRFLFEVAAEHGAGVLLDDPYFEVRTPEAIPVSAPAALLEFFNETANHGRRVDWCAVRSLGKQFGVNGWGVGSVTAHPSILKDLLDYAFRRRFPVNAHHEWALAQYLADPVLDQDAAVERASLASKQARLTATLVQLGWPPQSFNRGEYTPYFLVSVPPEWSSRPDGAERFRRDLLDHIGILVAHASIENASLGQGEKDAQWVRFYLGVTDEVFEEIIDRLLTGRLRYA